VAAAIDVTTTEGWSYVTMGGLAAEVGVSRQTVYNEVGAKADLAEAMVADELSRALAVVEAAFDDHPADAVAAVRGAARGVLDYAAGSPLLRAVVSATHGANTELLPLLTTQSSTLIATATTLLVSRLAASSADLDDRGAAALADVLVRTVLSHVMQPSGTPEQFADDVAWLAEPRLAARP
jgi:AcrR family transcriptional regulator